MIQSLILAEVEFPTTFSLILPILQIAYDISYFKVSGGVVVQPIFSSISKQRGSIQLESHLSASCSCLLYINIKTSQLKRTAISVAASFGRP